MFTRIFSDIAASKASCDSGSRLLGWPRGVGIASTTARDAVRRLVARGVLDLIERNTKAHHVVRLRLPLEVPAVRAAKIAADRPAPAPRAVNLEEEDFLRTRPLRQAIHALDDPAAGKLIPPLPSRERTEMKVRRILVAQAAMRYPRRNAETRE
jgi:hypothetical protein